MQPKIAGFEVDEKLFESSRTLIYRAREVGTERRVILKILNEHFPGPEDLVRHRQEFEVMQRLDYPSAIEVFELRRYQSTLMLVEEDFGGESLDRVLLRGRLSVIEALELAVQIVDHLCEIHSRGVIHRDVNPSNIVWNARTRVLKVIDFGLSAPFSRECPGFDSIHTLAGTLAYISPEQTGRMNRVVDYRSDFYSLGATLYELLTGVTPFSTVKDPAELVHCHIARVPRSPHELDVAVPEMVSQIVLKLLAKTAEDRYQSTHAIKGDLSRCLAALRAKGKVERFSLGEGDVAETLQPSQRLYGRGPEVAAVLASFAKGADGTRRLLLVSGWSGIGKTAVVQEVYRSITAAHGYFVRGKYDELQRDIPNAGILAALRALIQLILAEDEERLASWRVRLLHALSPNAKLLTDVLPELERIIGPQPAVKEVEPREAQARLGFAFRALMRALASREHPLVLFLDDLQWADPSSLRLLESFLGDEALGHFLLIAAYRDNEVSRAHPLVMTIDALEARGLPIDRVHLEPLGVEDVTALLADTLGRPLEESRALGALVMEKTRGNAFFVLQFLKALYQRRLLDFNREQGRWQWDLEAIRAQAFTENVVELVIARLRELPRATQVALSLAAHLGSSFELELLSLALEQESSAVFEALRPALGEGVLVARSGLSRIDFSDLSSPLVIESMRFSHDRVQQAAHLLLAERERAPTHLKIGRLLRDRLQGEARARSIFQIVQHLNEARDQIVDPAELEGLRRLNLEAGEKALAAQAAPSAALYLARAMDGGEAVWTAHPEHAFQASLARANAEALSGSLDRAHAILLEILLHVADRTRQVAVCSLRVRLLTLEARYAEARDVAAEGLRSFGLEIPRENLAVQVGPLVSSVRERLRERPIAELVELPLATDPDTIGLIALLRDLAAAGFGLDAQLVTWAVMQITLLSMDRGLASMAPPSIGFAGVVLGQAFGEATTAAELGRVAMAMARRLGDLSCEADCNLVYGAFVGGWVEPVRNMGRVLERGYQAGLTAGLVGTAAFCLEYKLQNALLEGAALPRLLEEGVEFARFARSVGNTLAHDVLEAKLGAVRQLIGDEEAAGEGARPTPDDEARLAGYQKRGSLLAAFALLVERALIHLLHGDAQPAVADLARAEALIPFCGGSLGVAKHAFLSALALSAALPEMGETDRPQARAKLDLLHGRLRQWAEVCPDNFRQMTLFVDAEVARLDGDLGASRFRYEEAIEDARAQGFVHHEALAHERLATLLVTLGKQSYAELHLLHARSAYERWGARVKVSELDKRFPGLMTGRDSRLTLSIRGSTEAGARGSVLDAMSVVKASQTIGSEIVLDRLLSTLMKVVIENAGAERGTLLLEKDGGLVVAAEGRAEGGVVVHPGTTLDAWEEGPRSLIHYVSRTQERVVLGDASMDVRFESDPYIRARRTRALLSMPIVKQGRLLAVLYLENGLASDAFTKERTEVLEILAGQMAVSIENALLLARAERAVKVRDDFLIVAAHELNTPLTSLMFSVEALRRAAAKIASPSPVERPLELVEQQARRLRRLIGDLLDISRVKTQQLALDLQELDLSAVVQQVIASLALDLRNARCAIAVEAGGPVLGYWDRGRLEQVITNLVLNAVKFGSGRPIEVMIRGGEGIAVIEVRDHGIGIDPKDQRRIFQCFERAVSTQNYGGLGVGLFVCQNIVDAHGGKIRVESGLGEGATFIVELPLGPRRSIRGSEQLQLS